MSVRVESKSSEICSNSPYSIDSYLKRIGYDSPVKADLETLTGLHRKHTAAIPFENLDVLRGKVISYEENHLIEKMLVDGRGGYCFEQNHLFAQVLRCIGFTVTPMLARVRWQAPVDRVAPLSHMILKVEVAGVAYLADVGFGGLGLLEPIEMVFDTVQHTRFEPRRLQAKDGFWMHQVLLKDEWQDVYQFVDQPAAMIDLEMGNWYSCTHPKARFKQDLMVTLSGDEKRTVLVNTRFLVRPHGGDPVTRELRSYPELLDVLRAEFGIVLPEDTRFDCPGLDLRD